MKKDIVFNKGVEIIREDKRITISQRGVTIRHEGKPLTSEVIGSVYLLIDCSSSMSEKEKLNQAKNGAIKFTREARTKGYLIGLIQFDSSVTHLCEPQKKISVLHQYLRSMQASGSTNMTDAILLVTQRLVGKKGFRVMVIATDGYPDNQTTTLEAASKAKEERIDIIAIGTDNANQDFLKQIASRSELAVKVSTVHFEQAITSAAKLLLAQNGGEPC